MERAIGEVFEFEGKKLKVVIGEGCGGCFFEYEPCMDIVSERGKCTKDHRKDDKSIIFKLLEE